jgi:hypothetical protein
MESWRQQAIAADESGDSLAAFELWGKLVETDTDGIASLKYCALAIELEKWEVAEVALTEANRLQPQASIVKVFLGRYVGRSDNAQASLGTVVEENQHLCVQRLCRVTNLSLSTLCRKLQYRLHLLPSHAKLVDQLIDAHTL